jgi:hypothetical protein
MEDHVCPEFLVVGCIYVTPIQAGGFWLRRDDGASREIKPGVLEKFLASQFRDAQ